MLLCTHIFFVLLTRLRRQVKYGHPQWIKDPHDYTQIPAAGPSHAPTHTMETRIHTHLRLRYTNARARVITSHEYAPC